jgi:cell wall-associated NlpC family hydrolase/3D (Asp-Asp-Asp) domain-containing protein
VNNNNRENFFKRFAKNKFKSFARQFVLKNPLVIGVIILLVIAFVIFGALAADIGDMGDNTVSSSLSTNDNKDILEDLQKYLDDKINVGVPDYVKYGDNYSGSGGDSVSIPEDFKSTSDVVNYALKFLGVPYLWGGTSPKGFDCSGLVQYCYGHFNINLPRTSQEQFKVGTSVDRSALKPGDLVFFEGNQPAHVGMYIGEGKYIQAPRTGDVVKVSLLSARNDYAGARRIADVSGDSGSSSDNSDTTSDSISENETDYTDAYNIIRKFYLSPGNVFGYMKYMEMSLGVKPEDFFSGGSGNDTEDNGDSDSQGNPVTDIINQKIIKEKIEKNDHKIADELKPEFTISNETTTDVVTYEKEETILGIDTGKKVTTTKKENGSIAVVTHISSIWGEIDLQYTQQTFTYTDSDGTHTVTKPVYNGYKLNGKLFSKLRKIIETDFSDEKDVDDAIYFIIESGFNFDKKEQNGDWINGKFSDLTLDSLLADLGGSNTGISAGMIPTFYQWDSRWGSNSYAGSTMDKLGSAPASLAMVVSGLEGKLGGYDKNSDGILEPNEAASYLNDIGVHKDTDVNDDFSNAALFFGLTMKHYGRSDYMSIANELKQGHPVIANVHGTDGIAYGSPGSTFTQGNHYIVLVDIDSNNKISVHDPYNKKNQNNRTWDLSSIIAAESSDYYAFNNPNIVYKSGVATAYTGDNIGLNGGTHAAWNGMDVSNKNLSNHLIAADKSIPFGTLVIVKVPENKRYWKMANGQKVDANGAYVVVDRGGAITGTHIDIYFGSGSYYNTGSGGGIANQFGRVNIKLRVTKSKISYSDALKH